MISIAIDGPTGAGKSTLARMVAQELGYTYVDTGALYRSLAYYAFENNISLGDEEALQAMLAKIVLEINYDSSGEQRIFLNGVDVSDSIRNSAVAEGASQISAVPLVREWLLDMQKNLALTKNIVMDGRDIGTVVLPDATIKLFITATPEARAGRRMKEYLAKGQKIGYNDVLRSMRLRDERDSSRAVAPLAKAKDAVEVENTEMSFQETLKRVLEIINDRIKSDVL